jgi:hypothetical protein
VITPTLLIGGVDLGPALFDVHFEAQCLSARCGTDMERVEVRPEDLHLFDD